MHLAQPHNVIHFQIGQHVCIISGFVKGHYWLTDDTDEKKHTEKSERGKRRI
jgi:hypothetical protein